MVGARLLGVGGGLLRVRLLLMGGGLVGIRGLLWSYGYLGACGVVRVAVGVECEMPDTCGVGAERLVTDLSGLAVHPDDAAVVVDGVENMSTTAAAVGPRRPGDEHSGDRAVTSLAEFVGYSGVTLVCVVAGGTEGGAGPVLDVAGAVAFAAVPVEVAVGIAVVGTGGGDLGIAVPGLDEGTGAVGAVVGAAQNSHTAVVLQLGPALERVGETLKGAVRVAREVVQQRLLVARRGQVQAVGVVIEARPDVVEGRAWGLGSSLGLLVLRCLGLRGRVLLVVLLRMRLVGLVVQWLLLLRVWLLLRVRLLVGVWLLVVGRCLRVRDVLRGGGLVALEVGLLVGGLLLVVGVLLVRVLLFRMLLMVGLVELLLERLRGLVGPGLGRGDRAGCVRV